MENSQPMAKRQRVVTQTEDSEPMAKRPREASPDEVDVSWIPNGGAERVVPQERDVPCQIQEKQPQYRNMDQGNLEKPSTSSENSKQYVSSSKRPRTNGASAAESEEFVTFCQVYGREIIPNAFPPCTLTSDRRCIPCTMEINYRSFSSAEECNVNRKSIYRYFGFNPHNYKTAVPFEMNSKDVQHDGFKVRKVPIRRLLDVQNLIDGGDGYLYGISIEEYMLVHQMRGPPEKDSRVLYPNVIRGGNYVQYIWWEVEDTPRTIKILRKAAELIRLSPPEHRAGHVILVLVRIYCKLVKKGLPGFLRKDQLLQVFSDTPVSLETLNSSLITIRKEEKYYNGFPTTPQDKKVDELIKKVLETVRIERDFTKEKFDQLRQVTLERIYEVIVENKCIPILNGQQIQKLSRALGCFGSTITRIFNQICFKEDEIQQALVTPVPQPGQLLMTPVSPVLSEGASESRSDELESDSEDDEAEYGSDDYNFCGPQKLFTDDFWIYKQTPSQTCRSLYRIEEGPERQRRNRNGDRVKAQGQVSENQRAQFRKPGRSQNRHVLVLDSDVESGEASGVESDKELEIDSGEEFDNEGRDGSIQPVQRDLRPRVNPARQQSPNDVQLNELEDERLARLVDKHVNQLVAGNVYSVRHRTSYQAETSEIIPSNRQYSTRIQGMPREWHDPLPIPQEIIERGLGGTRPHSVHRYQPY